MLLSQLTASAPRLALVGLAKNTGKTVALAALLSELRSGGSVVGVTSVGRDGEEHDVIDARIEKPAVRLWSGCLVATTDGLLRGSGIPHELLEQTDIRTPLGRVLIARLRGHGAIEVAGPSIAAEVRAVSDAMLGHGADQVLIDGAIDRRAASSPAVADALILSTGAILSEDIEEVVSRTCEAIELVRLPSISAEASTAAKIRALAQQGDLGAGLLIGEDPDQITPLPPRFVLTAQPPVIDGFLREGLPPRWLLVAGALPESFLDGLVPFVRRSRAPLTVLVSDPTHVFISGRSIDFYRRAGISLETLTPIDLRALTVNPLAPQSHSFDSAQLRGLLAASIPDLEIFDVMDRSYAAATVLPAGQGTSD